MKLITGTHRIIVIILVVIVSIAVIVLINQKETSNKDVLSETQDVTITGEVPHIISIIIKPESRIPPIGNDELPLVIEIRPEGSTIPIKTINATATATGSTDLGSISLAEVPVGTYDIAIKGLSHLRKVYTSQVFSGPSVRTYILTSPELAAGDTNPINDNYINSMDISYMTMNIYSADQRSDLTNDGIINSLDYAALIKNIYRHGDN